MSVPTLDLRRFDNDRDAFIAELTDAYERYGFLGLSHHGLNDQIVEQAMTTFKAFFALPADVKQQYHIPGGGGARGYTGYSVETAKDATIADLKEFWHVGRELPKQAHDDRLMPNVWPKEIDDFKRASLALYDALDDLGQRILTVMAIALGVDRDRLAGFARGGNTILRPLHYPPLPKGAEVPAGAVRAAQHEDVNLITLLLGSEEAGLEILSKTGDWVPVTIVPGAVVCNIGDMMQRITNHRFVSTTHRVVNPEGAAVNRSRYSIPFFVHPRPDVVLRTLPQCIDDRHPNRYPENVTAHEFLLNRLREIKLLAG